MPTAPKVRVVQKTTDAAGELSDDDLKRLLKAHKLDTFGDRATLWRRLQEALAEYESSDEEMPSLQNSAPAAAGAATSSSAPASTETPSSSSAAAADATKTGKHPAQPGRSGKGRGKSKDALRPPLERGYRLTDEKCKQYSHPDVTWHQNQHASWTKCKDCGLRMTCDSKKEHLVREGHQPSPKPTPKGKSKVETASRDDDCPHKEVRKGANQHASWETCTACGKRVSYTDKKTGSTTRFAGTVAEPAPVAVEDVLFTDTRGRVILDSGCRRTVAGTRWHEETQAWMRERGLQPVRNECRERFRFGDGRVVPAVCSWTYPCGVYGTNGMLNVAEVRTDCPPLLSLQSMKEMGVVLDFANAQVTVQGHTKPMETMPSGRPIVRIDEYADDATPFDEDFCLECQVDDAADPENSKEDPDETV